MMENISLEYSSNMSLFNGHINSNGKKLEIKHKTVKQCTSGIKLRVLFACRKS